LKNIYLYLRGSLDRDNSISFGQHCQPDDSRSFRERTNSWRPEQWRETPDERGPRIALASIYHPGHDSNPNASALSEQRRFRNVNDQFEPPPSSGFSRSCTVPNLDTLIQGRPRWIEQSADVEGRNSGSVDGHAINMRHVEPADDTMEDYFSR
jgi:hypothetical protein